MFPSQLALKSASAGREDHGSQSAWRVAQLERRGKENAAPATPTQSFNVETNQGSRIQGVPGGGGLRLPTASWPQT
eukprot:6026753-Pyramimonas_sp.AAC.1